MENLQRVIASILVVGVITVLGLLALRPITDLILFIRKRSDRTTSALFGLVVGLTLFPIALLFAMRISSGVASWVLAGPGLLGRLETESVFLGAVAATVGLPVLFFILLRKRLPPT